MDPRGGFARLRQDRIEGGINRAGREPAHANDFDDRVEAGEDRAEAERAVLTELGNPAKLAAGYADRPFYLIGPDLFPGYARLLTVLVAVVVPTVSAVVAISKAFQDVPIGSIIGATVGAALTTGVAALRAARAVVRERAWVGPA